MTWIGAIAKHDCFSRRQKARKRVDYRARLAMEEEARLEGEPGEDLLLYRLRLEKAMPAVRGKLREILRLSQQGLNHREIAVRMGVSRVAITRRLTRFKRNFQGAGLCPENSEKASGRMPFRADRTLGRNAPKAPIVRTLALEPAAQEPVFRLIAA
jgi:predicted RNA polymerase sigma factor